MTQGASISTEQARANLALWLRQGRARRGMTVDDVCRITKIQPRIVESLESGKFDRLPATVFVRGFVRSIARCVGLDADEALVRLGAVMLVGPGVATPVARALVETMSELAPAAAEAASASTSQAFEFVDLSELEPDIEIVYEEPAVDIPVEISAEGSSETLAASVTQAKKKRTRKPRGTDAPIGEAPKKRVRRSAAKLDGAEPAKPRRRKKQASGEAAVVVEAAVVEAAVVEAVVVEAPVVDAPVVGAPVVDAPVVDTVPSAVDFWAPRDVELVADAAPGAAEPPWQPTMPPAVAPPPWRRSFSIPVPTASGPILVIDDADPDKAEREQEARSPSRRHGSFLPSILLDRDDRSARQGGLTLAVIILLIAATLTLSYLMRRPSSSGDGVTMLDRLDTPAQLA